MELTPQVTQYLTHSIEKQPDFNQEVLVPLRQKQAQEAAEAAEKAKQAETAVKAPTAPTQTVTLSGDAMSNIFAKESGGRLNAVNSSGCLGLGQACPGSKLIAACPNYATDYACQVNFFTNYAVSRYGSWDGAWAFWQAKGWW